MLKKTTLALALGCALSLPAVAQTTGTGPYYANPSWDQTLPVTQRFIVLSNMNSNAVLDRETGLVWQRFPSNTGNGTDWFGANLVCNGQGSGFPDLNHPLNRAGWRLPNVQELLSLVDPTQNPALPQGHPFQDVQSAPYWTATAFEVDATEEYTVDFGTRGNLGVLSKTSNAPLVWCVRGGSSAAGPSSPPGP